jgi:hypothetical protein
VSLYERGNVWWSKLYRDGRPVYQSTGIAVDAPKVDAGTLRREAQRKDDVWAGEIAQGTFLARQDQVRSEDLVRLLVAHYERTGDRDLREVQKRLKPLAAHFAGMRAVHIEAAIDSYIDKRRKVDRVGNGTINREIGMLKRLFRIGRKKKVLHLALDIDKLKEPAPRSGFFETHQVAAVRSHLPVDLQLAIDIAHTYGWRMQSEVLTRETKHVDLTADTLGIDPGETKNDNGRVVSLTPALRMALAAQLERVRELGRQQKRIITCLFPHFPGPHINPRLVGTRRKDFRKAWLSACVAAGLGTVDPATRVKRTDRLRHDFRRTAVRNMEQANVPRSTATRITGHRSEAVYKRYAIVSSADLKDANTRQAARQAQTR